MYYHVWFVTKYRKGMLEGNIDKIAKDSFLEVVCTKEYNMLEMETNENHVHMLLEAKDKKELEGMVRILKSVSAKKILAKETPHSRAGNFRHFWARSFGRKIVHDFQIEGIRSYIRNQKKIA